MLTLRAAAQLIARADSPSAARPLARAIGFHDPLPVDAAARRSLGIGELIAKAELSSGVGALRLLTAELGPGEEPDASLDLRERTRRLAAALNRSAPDRLWCLLVIDPFATQRGRAGPTVCLATVLAHAGGPRVAALRVDARRVLDSDAETIRALAGLTDTEPLLRHARMGDVLRRDALGHRFYRALEQTVELLACSLTPRGRGAPPSSAKALPTHVERRELALLCASRCLFLAFLEAKGWLDGRRDFLLHHVVRQLEAGGRLHDRVLRPLFFGTLNTPRRHRAPAARSFGAVPFLNGGLFAPTALERRFQRWEFDDDAISHLVVAVIDRYRFTAHEDSSDWSEAAVDPEMLGRAFEGLMADADRKRSGSFYTPPTLVNNTIREALTTLFADTPVVARFLSGEPIDNSRERQALAQLRPRFESLRIIDPACGSGAFLVQLLETLDRLLAAAGDVHNAHHRRRSILSRSIFGVDREPMAVWLCELRLWLSVVIECHIDTPEQIPPLPNLDHHIRVGDSLAGGAFHSTHQGTRRLARLRERYAAASGVRKLRLADTLDREERARAVSDLRVRHDAVRAERHGLLSTLRARDLFGERRRPHRADRVRLSTLRHRSRELAAETRRLEHGAALPFRFAAMFADVGAHGGFDLVVGNPPWVRPHALPTREREWLRREFRTMRSSGWRHGAALAGAGAGFAAQADLSAAFVERSVQLLAPNGVLALLVPAKLWRTLSGGGVRRLLLEHTQLRHLHDWSDAPALFDAATYPSLIVASRVVEPLRTTEPALRMGSSNETHRHTPVHRSLVRCAVSRRHTVHFDREVDSISLERDAEAPWILLPPAAHAAFDAIQHAGVPLASTALGRPLLGVKCGCNAAFLVHAHEHLDDGATVTSLAGPARQSVIERSVLRPAIRGDQIPHPFEQTSPLSAADGRADLRVVWTHDGDGRPLRTLPPATTRWLAQWRPRLQTRRDSTLTQPWWALFRTEASRSELPRLVWADIAKQMRCTVLPAGDPSVPLNSCYVMRLPTLDDAYALHALLVSSVANAWLSVLAEPARGGFRRFLGWTVASFPVPADWTRAVRLLRPLGEALSAGSANASGAPTSATIDAAVLQAYQIPPLRVTPLLEWYRHE